MRKNLTLFAADADQWEADGMTLADEDALVMALWRWYRGRPSTGGLSIVSKVLYSSITKRLEASEVLHDARSRGGKKGMANRWGLNKSVSKSVITDLEYPSATASSPASSTTQTSSAGMDESITPPAHKRERFVRPMVDEVRAYCAEQRYSDVDPQRFVDFYESKGWLVGKSPMRDWKAAIRTWHKTSNTDEVSLHQGRTRSRFSEPVGMSIKDPSRKETDYVL